MRYALLVFAFCTAVSAADNEDLRTLSSFLRTLSAEQAMTLVNADGTHIYLNGLTKLNVDAARELSKSNATLCLSGLTSLDPATAAALVRKKPAISLILDGLTSLDVRTARALAKNQCAELSLDGLQSLDPDVVRALADYAGALSFRSLAVLDAATADSLAALKSSHLNLSGVATLDAGVAKALARFKGDTLVLNGLLTLDAETARALADFAGQYLYLNRLRKLDAEVANALAGFKGTGVSLNDVQTVDAETASALVRLRWLSLKGLVTLPPSVAVMLRGKSHVELHADFK